MSPPEPPIARIIDASLNRAAEGLRVVEDICRFGWELPGLSRELKELRHAVLHAFAPGAEARRRLSAERDIEGDIGRAGGPPGPSGARPARPDLMETAIRNLERAKEALRSLEEVGRIREPAAAREVESFRYRLYSIEKGVLALTARPGPGRLAGIRLCLLATQALTPLPLAEAVRAAVRGGAGAVQLREKGLPDRRLLEVGRALREITMSAGALLIVNDRPDLAVILGADGVHLGQDDLSVAHARRIVGEERLIGVSTHSLEEARKAVREGADYIGVGPVHASSTKEGGRPLGAERLRSIISASDLPAFAIGGIHAGNIGPLIDAGARRVAVSAGILGAGSLPAIEEAARALSSALLVDEGRRTAIE